MEQDTRIFYANAAEGNTVTGKDYGTFLRASERKMDMPGFDPEYLDVVHYILMITHRIWEEKSVGVIYDTYQNDTVVHRCSTTSHGIKGVIQGTMEDLYAFPDRMLAPEAVIWSVDRPGHYFSSHRNYTTGTHLGDSALLPASGRKIGYRAIADCYMTENRIYEEWLVRDALALVRCLGLEPGEVARNLARTARRDTLPVPQGVSDSMDGQFYPQLYTARDDSVGESLLELHSQVFNGKRFDQVGKWFAEDALMYFVGDVCLKGHDAIQGALLGFLSSFSSARHTVQRVTCNLREDGSADAAVRWVLQGLHSGWGMFGKPTGRPVEIMGINHYIWRDGRIVESYCLFDAVDVLSQLCAPEAEEPPAVAAPASN